MHKPARKSLNPNPVPDKLFYKIGEVSKITGVESYVLRYWETEFPFLKPRKNKSGQRVYVRKDLDAIMTIKRLLYQERYTIEGVRKRFEDWGGRTPDMRASQEEGKSGPEPSEILALVRRRLKDIIDRMK